MSFLFFLSNSSKKLYNQIISFETFDVATYSASTIDTENFFYEFESYDNTTTKSVFKAHGTLLVVNVTNLVNVLTL